MSKAPERKVSMRFGFQVEDRLFREAFASAIKFASYSKPEAYCLALEKSPLD